jgi:hypothetical protein
MATYVRGNLIQLTSQFTPPGWQAPCPQTVPPTIPPQPSAVVITLKYPVGSIPSPTPGCAPTIQYATAQVAMTLQADGVTWIGAWNSLASIAGTVFWSMLATGTVQSADQGSFTIQQNSANL